MGSSKKNKDKDRDRKKRKRERSRSKERDRHHRHHHKHKKHKRTREELSPSISLSDLSDFDADAIEIKKTPAKEYVSDNHQRRGYANYSNMQETFQYPSQSSPPRVSAPPSSYAEGGAARGGKEVSLSIEETNKIRAKLGLKPLRVESEVKKSEQEDGSPTYKPGEEIHKPAENLRDKIEVEKLREKIAAQREKRLLKQRMAKLKTLGESDGDEEDLKSWANKLRKIERDRREAEKKNKILEELDAQFGVGDLVEEEITQRKKHLYNSQNLGGLRVEHDVERFSEGQTTILTLKDSNILDGKEDTLVNVNIQDYERIEKNLKLRKMKPDDVQYDAPEVDEFGRIVQKTVLTKYDEEIAGEKKNSFRIGRQGEGMEIDEPTFRSISGAMQKPNKIAKLRQLTSLDMPASQLATEYLTSNELTSFRKVKKKKKKKKMLTADDLELLEDGELHFGSRHSRRPEQMKVYEDEEPRHGVNQIKSLKELMEEDEIEEKMIEEEAPKEDESESENDDIELQEAIARSRRAKQNANRKKPSNETLTDSLVSLSDKKLSKFTDENMTLNLTDEFCRSLGDIPTYGLSGNRAEDDAVMLPSSPPKTSEAWDTQGAWEEVDIEETKVEITSERNIPILEEEPDTGRGVVNALKLAIKKGYMEKGNANKPANATLQHLRAVHYSIEDKTVDEERRGRGGDRYMGPTMDFKEKDTYRPDVKLEYVDDEGRKLNAKEAFRYLSHKFHGKGSGKNKLEKRMKKWQEELLMKHMSSSDTPLQTLERQREKQKQLGAAYLVLSGSKTQETLDVKK